VRRHHRWDDALAAWQLAAKVDDKNNPAYIHYQGLAHFKLNQFKPAETMFEAALSLGFERSAEQLGLVRRLMAEQNASELYSEPQHNHPMMTDSNGTQPTVIVAAPRLSSE